MRNWTKGEIKICLGGKSSSKPSRTKAAYAAKYLQLRKAYMLVKKLEANFTKAQLDTAFEKDEAIFYY